MPAQREIIIAAVAFIAGAGISWLIASSVLTKEPPAQLQTSMAITPSVPVEAGSVTGAPDVAQLPPAQAAVLLGNSNYDEKNWQKAIESYQQAISLGTDNPDVRTDLGNALRFSGQPQLALEQYKIARRENPLHENSLCNMATLYAQVLNDPLNAANTWREYLRLFPNGEKAAVAKQYISNQDALP